MSFKINKISEYLQGGLLDNFFKKYAVLGEEKMNEMLRSYPQLQPYVGSLADIRNSLDGLKPQIQILIKNFQKKTPENIDSENTENTEKMGFPLQMSDVDLLENIQNIAIDINSEMATILESIGDVRGDIDKLIGEAIGVDSSTLEELISVIRDVLDYGYVLSGDNNSIEDAPNLYGFLNAFNTILKGKDSSVYWDEQENNEKVDGGSIINILINGSNEEKEMLLNNRYNILLSEFLDTISNVTRNVRVSVYSPQALINNKIKDFIETIRKNNSSSEEEESSIDPILLNKLNQKLYKNSPKFKNYDLYSKFYSNNFDDNVDKQNFSINKFDPRFQNLFLDISAGNDVSGAEDLAVIDKKHMQSYQEIIDLANFFISGMAKKTLGYMTISDANKIYYKCMEAAEDLAESNFRDASLVNRLVNLSDELDKKLNGGTSLSPYIYNVEKVLNNDLWFRLNSAIDNIVYDADDIITIFEEASGGNSFKKTYDNSQDTQSMDYKKRGLIGIDANEAKNLNEKYNAMNNLKTEIANIGDNNMIPKLVSDFYYLAKDFMEIFSYSMTSESLSLLEKSKFDKPIDDNENIILKTPIDRKYIQFITDIKILDIFIKKFPALSLKMKTSNSNKINNTWIPINIIKTEGLKKDNKNASK